LERQWTRRAGQVSRVRRRGVAKAIVHQLMDAIDADLIEQEAAGVANGAEPTDAYNAIGHDKQLGKLRTYYR